MEVTEKMHIEKLAIFYRTAFHSRRLLEKTYFSIVVITNLESIHFGWENLTKSQIWRVQSDQDIGAVILSHKPSNSDPWRAKYRHHQFWHHHFGQNLKEIRQHEDPQEAETSKEVSSRQSGDFQSRQQRLPSFIATFSGVDSAAFVRFRGSINSAIRRRHFL